MLETLGKKVVVVENGGNNDRLIFLCMFFLPYLFEACWNELIFDPNIFILEDKKNILRET